ncbi:hypothetical protein Ccrd_010775 [Cynara cardunculus var. scolymus]|uniref:PB1 domain-containing protein n=1 Tax=Cynara cardunculus var. scolymus TaxID=59895 RepID=A0A118K6L4_CYNCS|nr:hypothetical protein Ccrd_010775 [Cynara cardunculus var. scolymus]
MARSGGVRWMAIRYVGGHTIVVCGFLVNFKCKVPTEDLNLVVTITSYEDLVAVVEEYNRVSPNLKIRVVLFPVGLLKTISSVFICYFAC